MAKGVSFAALAAITLVLVATARSATSVPKPFPLVVSVAAWPEVTIAQKARYVIAVTNISNTAQPFEVRVASSRPIVTSAVRFRTDPLAPEWMAWVSPVKLKPGKTMPIAVEIIVPPLGRPPTSRDLYCYGAVLRLPQRVSAENRGQGCSLLRIGKYS